MTINNNYNFGLLTDDGTTSAPTSLQNLKSFTVLYDSNTSQFSIINNLTDYEVLYYNTTQNGPNRLTYSGLVVFNKKGNNFVILCDNAFQQFITSAQYLLFSSNGQGPNTSGIPSMNTLFGYEPVTYPELPTFINGYNGYNVPNNVFTNNPTTYTFYIMD